MRRKSQPSLRGKSSSDSSEAPEAHQARRGLNPLFEESPVRTKESTMTTIIIALVSTLSSRKVQFGLWKHFGVDVVRSVSQPSLRGKSSSDANHQHQRRDRGAGSQPSLRGKSSSDRKPSCPKNKRTPSSQPSLRGKSSSDGNTKRCPKGHRRSLNPLFEESPVRTKQL